MSRIQLRLIGVLSALVLAVVATAGSLAERQLRAREHEQIQASLTEQAQLVRALVSAIPLDAGHVAQLDTIARQAGDASNARVTLIAADGRVVADSEVVADRLPQVANHADRPEVRAASAGRLGVSQRLSETVGRPMLYLAVPGGGGGVVRLAVSLEEVDAQVADLRRRLVAAGGVGLAAAVVLAFVISQLTLRPVEELRAVVGAIAEGKLERRLAWRAGDELGEIASSINSMAEQLRQRLDDATAEKEQLEAVLASMVEGVLVLEDGTVVLANPRARELLRVWGEIEGRRPLEVIRNREIDAALSRAAGSREPVVEEIELDDGTPRRLLIHAVAFPRGDTPTGTVAVFHDITEIRQLEEVRRDFIANASHELRTPLTSIRGFADTLLNNPLSKEEMQPYLEVIVRNAERLGNLIEDLLTLSRIESRKVPLRPAAIDVFRLGRVLASDLEPRIREVGIELSVVGDGVVKAWADRQAVEQVLSNLLDNAVKYTDPGGRIEVEVRGDASRVRVHVRDTGIGIPPDARDRIFERFYRVDKARSRALGGTGLGLSIVKHLVQAMGGEIGVESEPGKGTCFTFALPTAESAPRPQAPESA